ncbi:MAG: cAMP-binding protein [uncultured bacterium]|nr:MAG: cAMP-binding protein [uncultured bacterium]
MSGDDRFGFAGYCQFLVGGYAPDLDPALRRTEQGGFFNPLAVGLKVESDPERLQPLQALPPHHLIVLADAGGEDNRVHPAENRHEGADIFFIPVGLHRKGKLGPLVAGRDCLVNVAHIVQSAQSFQTGLLVQQPIDGLDVHIAVAGEKGMDRRIDVTAPGSHHQPLKRRETQAGIDAFAVFHRRHRTAVAEMNGDRIEGIQRLAHEPRALGCHIFMGSPVKTVPADALLFIQFARDGVVIGVGRDGLVEGGVEDCYLRHPDEKLLRHPNAVDIRRVVERGKRYVFLDRRHDLGVDYGGLVKILAAMHHPVADRIDIRTIGNNTLLSIGEQIDRHPHPGRMVGDHIGFLDRQFTARSRPQRAFYLPFGLADSLDQARGQHRFVLHIEQLKLNRRTPGVDHEYFHFSFLFFIPC